MSIYAQIQRLTDAQKTKFRKAKSAGADDAGALKAALGKGASPNLRAIAKTLASLAHMKGNDANRVPFPHVEKMLNRKLTKAERESFREAFESEVHLIIHGRRPAKR